MPAGFTIKRVFLRRQALADTLENLILQPLLQ
jgi:hypothetical protein